MKKIQIEWLTDSWECDDCGVSFAQGAIVTLDEEDGLPPVIILEMLPSAHCHGGADYSETDVYKAILVELGYGVVEM